MISKDTALRAKLRRIADGHGGIEDVILFGSAVRGKEKPSDIDVLVLFRDKIDKTAEYALRKEIERRYPRVSILSKTLQTAQDPSFDARESLLFEGVSLLSGKTQAGRSGFDALGMFKYTVGGWSNLQKTKFYHALNGRGGQEGMLARLGGMRLSNNLILAPLDRIEPVRAFLGSWDVKYLYVPLLIPQRLDKKNILAHP